MGDVLFRLFRPERQPPHGGMQAVGPHHQVEGAGGLVREVHPCLALILFERRDAVPEHILRIVAGALVQQLHQVLAQQLDVVAVQPPAAVGRLGGPLDLVAVGVEQRHPPHPGTDLLRLLQQPHPGDDVERDTADVHGLPAPTQAGRALDDGGREAATAQQMGKRGSGDAAAGDEYGLHGKPPSYGVRD